MSWLLTVKVLLKKSKKVISLILIHRHYRIFMITHFLPREQQLATVMGSIDHGRTWELLGGADIPGRSIDEHMLVGWTAGADG